MTAVNYTRGVKLVLKVSQGGSPETFAALCTINAERGLSFNANLRDEVIPDCSNPDLPGWVAREAESFSMEFTGGGMLDKGDLAKFWAWKGEGKNCQIILDDDTAANVVTFEGEFILGTFDVAGNRGEKVTATMGLSSNGEVTATFGANVGGGSGSGS